MTRSFDRMEPHSINICSWFSEHIIKFTSLFTNNTQQANKIISTTLFVLFGCTLNLGYESLLKRLKHIIFIEGLSDALINTKTKSKMYFASIRRDILTVRFKCNKNSKIRYNRFQYFGKWWMRDIRYIVHRVCIT